jgi:hypothetical protein
MGNFFIRLEGCAGRTGLSSLFFAKAVSCFEPDFKSGREVAGFMPKPNHAVKLPPSELFSA